MRRLRVTTLCTHGHPLGCKHNDDYPWLTGSLIHGETLAAWVMFVFDGGKRNYVAIVENEDDYRQILTDGDRVSFYAFPTDKLPQPRRVSLLKTS